MCCCISYNNIPPATAQISLKTMKKNSLKTGNLSYADSLAKANQLLVVTKRDSAELESFGVTRTDIETFEMRIAAQRQSIADSEMEAQKMQATEYKNQAADALRLLLRKLMFSIKKDGNMQPITQSMYRILNLSGLRENEFYLQIDLLSIRIQNNSEMLENAGVNASLIEEFEAEVRNYQLKVLEHREMAEQRKIRTEVRRKATSELYQQMALICEAGKMVWQGINNSRYSDYVLYAAKRHRNTFAETDDGQTAITEKLESIVK